MYILVVFPRINSLNRGSTVAVFGEFRSHVAESLWTLRSTDETERTVFRHPRFILRYNK